jgi:DNA-binding response OmpR family regulator
MNKILLVEDDKSISDMIVNYFNLKSAGKLVTDTAYNGNIAIDKAYKTPYDLLLLDIMLPELDGFEVCREIRRYSDIPIIFITARTAQEDILTGYGLGCDDYISKPFSLPVLYEKVMALIRRSKGLVRNDILSVGNVTLNPNNGIVCSNGEEIILKAKEYNVLKILLENKNSIVSRETMLNKVWGYDTLIDERVLDTHIKNLRKALGDNGKLIKTYRFRGYRIGDE